MLQKLKVLQAGVALHEFTVRDVADYTSVPATTVRTVLDRERELFTADSVEPSGQRGGRWKIYRATPRAADEVAELLRANQEVVAQFSPRPNTPPPPSPEARLAAAENLLVQANDAQDRGLPLAARAIAELREEVDLYTNTPLFARVQAADALARTIEGSAVEGLEEQWDWAVRELVVSGQGDQARILVDKAATSELGVQMHLPDPDSVLAFADVVVIDAVPSESLVTEKVVDVLHGLQVRTYGVEADDDPTALGQRFRDMVGRFGGIPVPPAFHGAPTISMRPPTALFITANPGEDAAASKRMDEVRYKCGPIPMVMITGEHDRSLQVAAIEHQCAYVPIGGLEDHAVEGAFRHTLTNIHRAVTSQSGQLGTPGPTSFPVPGPPGFR